MKLILCKLCLDVVRLSKELRRCECGDSWGIYLDHVHAIYGGDNAVPLGITNQSLSYGINNQPRRAGLGEPITAFVIPKVCSTMEYCGQAPEKILKKEQREDSDRNADAR